MGTSVMEGRKVSDAQTWWQRRVRYRAGGMILFLLVRSVEEVWGDVRRNQLSHA